MNRDAGGPAFLASRRWRVAGIVLGWALLIAAIVMVVRQRATLADAWHAVQSPDRAALAVLVGAVLANTILSAIFLRTLITRYGRVGGWEMQALIAAATLLNFLPLRPGLFGRIAYHKAVNGIPVADSAKTVVQALVVSMILAGYLALAVAAQAFARIPLAAGVALPFPVLLIAAVRPTWRRWCLAGLVRHLEFIVWAVRYGAAFVLIGHPLTKTAAVAFAAASSVANMVPFVSNGLGVREWAIGLLAPVFAVGTVELGVTAELVNRAVEIVVAAGAGATGIFLLARWRNSRLAGTP